MYQAITVTVQMYDSHKRWIHILEGSQENRMLPKAFGLVKNSKTYFSPL